MLDTPTIIYWWHIKSNDKKKGLIWKASVKNKQRKRTRARLSVHLHTAAVCINRELNSTITVHSFNCATAMLPFNSSANSFETKHIIMERRYISIQSQIPLFFCVLGAGLFFAICFGFFVSVFCCVSFLFAICCCCSRTVSGQMKHAFRERKIDLH